MMIQNEIGSGPFILIATVYNEDGLVIRTKHKFGSERTRESFREVALRYGMKVESEFIDPSSNGNLSQTEN